MTHSFKPGDRVRVKDACETVEMRGACGTVLGGPNVNVQLDDGTRAMFMPDELEPAPSSAPGAESLREEIARALHEGHKPFCDYTYEFEDPMSSSRVYYALADTILPLVSSRLAAAEERIAELTQQVSNLHLDIHDLCMGGGDERALIRQEWWDREHRARKAAEALAESEREECAKVAEAEKSRCRARANLQANTAARNLWLVCGDTSGVIADLIRSRETPVSEEKADANA